MCILSCTWYNTLLDIQEAADLEVKRNVPDFKADKLDTVKNTVPGLEVDNVSTLNKSFNNNSVKTNSPEKVEPTSFANEKELYVADKEKELSVAAFRVLLSKRERLVSLIWLLSFKM